MDVGEGASTTFLSRSDFLFSDWQVRVGYETFAEDGTELASFFPSNATVFLFDFVTFDLTVSHAVAFIPPGKSLLVDYPQGLACPPPFGSEPYNESDLTSPFCLNPYFNYPNPLQPPPNILPGGFPALVDGENYTNSGWYQMTPFQQKTWTVRFQTPGTYVFIDMIFQTTMTVTVVNNPALVPYTPAQFTQIGTDIINAKLAAKPALLAQMEQIAEAQYYGGSSDGYMQYNVLSGYNIGDLYSFRFLPQRTYVANVNDTINFIIPSIRLPAPHIVSFLNNNPDFIPVQPKFAPPNTTLPKPFSDFPPDLPILMFSPKALFPWDPVNGVGGKSFAPRLLRAPLGTTGIFASGFMTGIDPAVNTSRGNYDWTIDKSLAGKSTEMICEFHPHMNMRGTLNVTTDFTGPAAPTVYHATMFSYAAPGNLTGNTGVCTDYNFLVELTLNPWECTLLGETYPFYSWVMATPARGPPGTPYQADTWVHYMRWDLFNALPPCGFGLANYTGIGVLAPATNCLLPLNKSCAPCNGIVQMKFSMASQAVACLWLLLLALLVLLQ